MNITIEQLLKGKATKIKDKEYNPTEAYVVPFLDRMEQKFPKVKYNCKVELPKQITIDPSKVEDITYNRVWIEAVLPDEYCVDNHDRAFGMVYGLDVRVPIVKFYNSAINRACTNLCVFNPNDLSVQAIEEKKAIDYRSLDRIMERQSEIKVFLDKLKNTTFDCSVTAVAESLGHWIDNSIEESFSNGINKASIATSTIISAYKLLFKTENSGYYVGIDNPANTNMFNVYNAFTQIITHKDTDIMNKAEKELLLLNILGIH